MTRRADQSQPATGEAVPPGTRGAGGRLAGQQIALLVTGSIAAFKAPVIARLLRQQGAEVKVALSRAAREFVGPATFAGLTGNPVVGDMFDHRLGGELHVDLAAGSHLLLVAPATADVISRLAAGRADDTITATVLCARCPVLVAPAMHPAMWAHPATQRNVAALDQDGRVTRVGPVWGEVATGEVGVGRMAEPEAVLAEVLRQLSASDLSGRRLVISAGPTAEDLDPVRFLGNRSSGKMGYALAERAATRGAKVTLVSGPVALPPPEGVEFVPVRSAANLREALWRALGPDLDQADALVMAAAVADYRPAETSASKLKRDTATLTVELVQNPDILAEIGHSRQGAGPVLIGFALETGSDDAVIDRARGKLRAKRVDLVVANRAGEALERDDNRATLVEADSTQTLEVMPKGNLADHILDWLSQRLSDKSPCQS